MRDLEEESYQWLLKHTKIDSIWSLKRIVYDLYKLNKAERVFKGEVRERSIYWDKWDGTDSKEWRRRLRVMLVRFLTKEEREAFRHFCQEAWNIRI